MPRREPAPPSCGTTMRGRRSSSRRTKAPVTLADHASEAIILAALADSRRTYRSFPRRPLATGLRGSRAPLLPGRSARRHQGVHREALGLHRQHRARRERRPALRLVYAPARELSRPDSGGQMRRPRRELAPSEDGADLARSSCAHSARGSRSRKASSPWRAARISMMRRRRSCRSSSSRDARMRARRSKFLLVARGEADVYPRFGPTMEWDTAAGHAVLHAAGGHVVDRGGSAVPLRQERDGFAAIRVSSPGESRVRRPSKGPA